MEERDDADKWDAVNVETRAKAYVDVREEMWKLLAQRMGVPVCIGVGGGSEKFAWLVDKATCLRQRFQQARANVISISWSLCLEFTTSLVHIVQIFL